MGIEFSPEITQKEIRRPSVDDDPPARSVIRPISQGRSRVSPPIIRIAAAALTLAALYSGEKVSAQNLEISSPRPRHEQVAQAGTAQESPEQMRENKGLAFLKQLESITPDQIKEPNQIDKLVEGFGHRLRQNFDPNITVSDDTNADKNAGLNLLQKSLEKFLIEKSRSGDIDSFRKIAQNPGISRLNQLILENARKQSSPAGRSEPSPSAPPAELSPSAPPAKK
jgi:hypothetical protein